MPDFVDLILHLDGYLAELVSQYGVRIYAILFAVIFCETGLVVTPYLPGDSLLFAAGSLAAIGKMDVHALFGLLSLAAVLGNTVNYAIGHYLGEKVLAAENIRFVKKEYLVRTQRFFDKHGGKAIILTRFVPIIRTFAPFLAGAGGMSYPRFLIYNLIGGIAWNATFLYGGYLFGNLPFVKQNFTLVILAIIIVSILPAIIEYWRHRAETA